jgi:Fic family protein
MISGDYRYIWQAPDWPRWRYDLAALASPLADASRAQGMLLGRLADVGLVLRDQASLAALTDDVVETSAIEGESLDEASVRSSIARRLGVDIGALAPADRHVEGIVELVLDATERCHEPITEERLLGWHAALFPTGHSGISRIRVAAWRDDATGPMQVVSGPMHRRKVHFEAPPAGQVPAEMARFLAWANGDTGEPPLIKAGLAHLWFVTLHPLDDGNGRIARALGDLFLALDGSPRRFYSPSAGPAHAGPTTRCWNVRRRHARRHRLIGVVPGEPAPAVEAAHAGLTRCCGRRALALLGRHARTSARCAC